MTESSPPVLRVISGNPTPEEVAALTVVLTALSGGADDSVTRPNRIGGWADSAARLRTPHRPGVGAWRATSWR
jgi:hypothetical protein